MSFASEGATVVSRLEAERLLEEVQQLGGGKADEVGLEAKEWARKRS